MENNMEKNETMTDTEELEKAADALLEKAEEKPAPKKRPNTNTRGKNCLTVAGDPNFLLTKGLYKPYW